MSTEQPWSRAKGPFAAVFTAPALWLLFFFLVPLAIIWAYSFGTTQGLTDIDINGTFSNYVRMFLAALENGLRGPGATPDFTMGP